MRDRHADPLMGREDFGEVTVMRAAVPMLRSDETTQALFQHLNALVDEAGRSRLVLNFHGVGFISSMVKKGWARIHPTLRRCAATLTSTVAPS